MEKVVKTGLASFANWPGKFLLLFLVESSPRKIQNQFKSKFFETLHTT